MFYTTATQERELDLQHQRTLAEKQASVDPAIKEQKFRKYHTCAYVPRPNRLFLVTDHGVYLGDTSEVNRCPDKPGDGYAYPLDLSGRYAAQYKEFCAKYPHHRVTILTDGRYGPTVQYTGDSVMFPAILEAPDGTRLVLDDEKKYELVCC